MTTHHFSPTHYHITLGSHAPVLHIAPGDTVETTTVDAHGIDMNDQQITEEGNPMTGPFYVDGAEPGDILLVRIESVVPNRRRGWSRRVLAPNVVDPALVAVLPRENEKAYWDVDVAAKTVMLKDPGDTALGRVTLPLEPMIGCFGVAPAGGEFISTATSGPHGGNMDYRGFRPGVTVGFPVFVPGALFHLGDVHARQGHGEIVGTGVEISAAIRFSVSLRKGRPCYWPCAEDEDTIFTAGNARPLDQALQHATSQMLLWLGEDYGLDFTAASLLLGQAVEYEVGNVFDPAYTVVCKLPRRVVDPFRREAGRM